MQCGGSALVEPIDVADTRQLQACDYKVPCAAPPPPPPPPPPGPSAWPVFASAAALSASPWGAYYQAVYGSLPTSYPLDIGANWLLHDGAMIKARVPNVPVATSCPSKELDHYSTNNMYQPPLVSWIWHAYPYAALAANSWVEVTHEADPFGDEHHGMWLVYAPGSGIYFNTGVRTALRVLRWVASPPAVSPWNSRCRTLLSYS